MSREREVQLYHWRYFLRIQHVRTFLYLDLFITAATVPVSNATGEDCPGQPGHRLVNVDSVNDIKSPKIIYDVQSMYVRSKPKFRFNNFGHIWSSSSQPYDADIT